MWSLIEQCLAYRFWKRGGYVPLYVRQTASELTGEHTCVMVRGLNSSADDELQWLGEFAKGMYSIGRPGKLLCS